jgi:CelD/BcsL family acetyltransferase involved in cellulose biosynthesis
VLALCVVGSGPARILRVAGHGAGDELGPVCLPEDRARVARALPRALDRLGARVLVAEQLPRAAGWSALTGGRVLRTEGSPIVRLDAGDWDAWLSTRSRNMRKQLRRQERRLEREHGLRYRLVAGPRDDVQGDLDTLMALHDARWPEGTSPFARHAPFHRDFATLAARRGWLRLWFAEADDRPVAAGYGLRFAGVEADYQGGRDPSWRGPSVGFVLLARAIRAALEDGVREYRLLRGSEWYKYRFADDDAGVETIVVTRGPLAGAAAAAGAMAPDAATALVRRRLRA